MFRLDSNLPRRTFSKPTLAVRTPPKALSILGTSGPRWDGRSTICAENARSEREKKGLTTDFTDFTDYSRFGRVKRCADCPAKPRRPTFGPPYICVICETCGLFPFLKG